MPVAFVLILGLLIALAQLDFVEYAHEKMGVALPYVFTVLLRRPRAMGAPIASNGGAGTFDGVFVTGIPAVLLA